MRCILTAERA